MFATTEDQDHRTPPFEGAAAGYDLLRGGSDLADLALLAARGSAAARRAGEGSPLDAEGERSLGAIAQLLEESAKVVDSFGPAGSAAAPPSGALAAQVDVAIDAVLHTAGPPIDPQTLAALLQRLARQVRVLISSPSPTTADPLVDVLAHLASSVLREMGSVGEITSTL